MKAKAKSLDLNLTFHCWQCGFDTPVSLRRMDDKKHRITGMAIECPKCSQYLYQPLWMLIDRTKETDGS